MKNLKKKLFFLSFIMFTIQLSAQEVSISGSVVDAESQTPLIGANVLIEGTNKGTVTDFDGKYTIKAKVGDVLIVTYLGFEASRITVGNSTTINMQLMPSSDTLNEIVVIGYGTSTRKDLSGSVECRLCRKRAVPYTPHQNTPFTLQVR